MRWAEIYIIHNKQEFEIERIDNNHIVLTDGETLDLQVVKMLATADLSSYSKGVFSS